MSADRSESKGADGTILDGVTFEIIVSRRRHPQEGGQWLLRAYAGSEHVHSAEGGVSLGVGLSEVEDAVRDWLVQAGALDPASRRRVRAVPRETVDLPDVDALLDMGETVGYCSKCGEAREAFYICRDGGKTIPKGVAT